MLMSTHQTSTRSTEHIRDEEQADFVELAMVLHTPIIRLWRHMRSEAEHLRTPALHVTLLFQIRAEPGIGVSELAARERMRPSTMNVHLREISEAGLITRDETDLSDRRRVGLVITPKGAEFLEEVLRRRYRFLVHRFAQLSTEDREHLRKAVPVLMRLSEGYVP